MTEAWRLGIDVVDLTAPRVKGKATHEAFLQRVLTRAERDLVAGSPDPDRTLWLLWAAKEATFKSATKVLGAPPTFVHTQFRVHFSPGGLRNEEDQVGRATYRNLTFRLQGRVGDDHVQVLAWSHTPGRGEPPVSWGFTRIENQRQGSLEELRPHFSPGEWECIAHQTSALCRLEARKALAAALDIQEKRLEIRCGPGDPGRRIPLAFQDGVALPVELTLSHDGPFLAWAFLEA